VSSAWRVSRAGTVVQSASVCTGVLAAGVRTYQTSVSGYPLQGFQPSVGYPRSTRAEGGRPSIGVSRDTHVEGSSPSHGLARGAVEVSGLVSPKG